MSMCRRGSTRETVFLNSKPAQLGYPGPGGTAIPGGTAMPAVLHVLVLTRLEFHFLSNAGLCFDKYR